jgi:hypothetical protein
MPLRACSHSSRLRASGSSATVRRLSGVVLPLAGRTRLIGGGIGRLRSIARSGWPGLGCSFHGHVQPDAALGGEPGMFPELAGGAVVQDVAPDRQTAGVGLIQLPPDQSAPDAGAAELRQERDVDDEDLVAGVVDDEPAGSPAALMTE